jgi:hypothetical protein
VSDTIGNQLPQPDPRGWLAFDAPLPDALQRAEDSTQAADFDHRRFGRKILRPATAAERTLLQHLGYELPEHLTTAVSFKSTSCRHRSWPQLEITQEVTP